MNSETILNMLHGLDSVWKRSVSYPFQFTAKQLKMIELENPSDDLMNFLYNEGVGIVKTTSIMYHTNHNVIIPIVWECSKDANLSFQKIRCADNFYFVKPIFIIPKAYPVLIFSHEEIQENKVARRMCTDKYEFDIPICKDYFEFKREQTKTE